jgi:hypothetical protein
MSIKGKGGLLAVGMLASILAAAAPAMAQGGGHGGGGGGGGHASGGGHSTGASHGSSGGHAMGASHFAGASHYAGAAHYGGGAQRYSAAYHGGGYGGHGYTTSAYGHGGYGRSWGGGYGRGWGGGYWHGGFWPRSYYGAGFSWFLPILPLAYATYWYGGVPYYYANDVYYTWNPSYSGYTATDPPPVAESAGDAGSAGGAGPNDAPEQGPGPSAAAGGQLFMYPKNGQSAEQQASDRAECQKWAADQAGQVAQNGSDYNRAMVACVEGRGYSAR